MQRDKVQKQLESETKRRVLVEWPHAKREWQLGLALECTDLSAAAFAATILAADGHPEDCAYMSDKDVAVFIDVADSAIRTWAHRGHIGCHTSDGVSILHLMSEVRARAKANIGGRKTSVRRLANLRNAAL